MMKKLIIALTLLTVSVTLLIGCAKAVSLPPASPVNPQGTPNVRISPSPTLSPSPLPADNSSDPSSLVLQSGLPLKVTEPIDASTITADSVVVKGQTKPGATVNANDEVDTADGNGNFSISLSLEDGLNAIDVIASDDNGNQGEVLLMVNADLSQTPDSQALSDNSTVSPDAFQNPFVLKVTQPVDGATLNQDSTVKGQTVPEATIIVNDTVDFADANGNFTVPVSLDSGQTAIDVVAIDANGNQSEVLLLVNVN